MFPRRLRSDGSTRLLAAAATIAALGMSTAPIAAAADSRAETLIIVTEEGPSTLDIDAANANVETHGASWNTYDRLPAPTGTRGSIRRTCRCSS